MDVRTTAEREGGGAGAGWAAATRATTAYSEVGTTAAATVMAAMSTRDGDGGATELPHRKVQKKGRIRSGKKARGSDETRTRTRSRSTVQV